MDDTGGASKIISTTKTIMGSSTSDHTKTIANFIKGTMEIKSPYPYDARLDIHHK